MRLQEMRLAGLEVLYCLPQGEASRTVLCVHGAFHNARSWDQFLPFLAARGIAAYAVSLRGHGGSHGRDQIHWTSASDYLRDLELVCAEIQPDVLIGHSMGGYLIRRLLENNEFRGALYIAPAPSDRFRLFGIMARLLWHNPKGMLKSLIYRDTSHFTGMFARDEFFFPDLAPYMREVFRSRYPCDVESLLIQLEYFLHPAKPPARSTRQLTVAGERDRIVPLHYLTIEAQQGGISCAVVSGPGSSHVLMLDSQWRLVATLAANFIISV